jgi:hypothetical protein
MLKSQKLPQFWNTGNLAAAALLAGVLIGYITFLIVRGVALIGTPGRGFKMPGANMVCTTFEGVDRDDDSENFS